MLEEHYSTQFHELIRSIDWEIELPIEWTGYFDDRGEIASYADDERNNQRLKVRTHGVLWLRPSPYPFALAAKLPWASTHETSPRMAWDSWRRSQIYPEEQVRILLPTFWVQLEVVRARRITSKCYELGAKLIRRHDPSPDAFVFCSHSAPLETEPLALGLDFLTTFNFEWMIVITVAAA